MQIITAPSKTQECRTRRYSQYSLPPFLAKSQSLINLLKNLREEELAALMKTSDKLTQATLEKINSFHLPFSLENACQSIFTFQGDAYDSISPDSYIPAELTHAQGHLFILSGLYGLLRPLDLMQPYRLEMGAKLSAGDCKNLYQFWKTEVTEVINRGLEKSGEKKLINLASREYSKVVDKKLLNGDLITIVFKQPHKDGYKTIPIYSKRARGLMIHFMITAGISRSEGLKDFDLDGYSFDASQSTESSWLFVQTRT